MKVLFDGVQINSDYIYEISKEHQLFSDTFKLGSVSARTYKLVIEKGVANTPSVVQLLNDDDSYEATLQVDNIEEDSELTLRYSLIDAMVNLSLNYDASEVVGEEGATVLDVLQDICAKAGLTLASTEFDGADISTSYYNNQLTAREYVSYIASLNGGYAIINAEGQLELKKFSNTVVDTIDVKDCDSFILGEGHTITRVLYDDNDGTYWEYGDETGDTLYLDFNNPYINNQETVEMIYNSINGFMYYSIKVDNCPIGNAIVGETIVFTLDDANYPTMAQISQTYTGDSWYGGYTLELASSKQEETKVAGVGEKLKTMTVIIDRDRNEFTRQISEVADNVQTVSDNLNNVEQDLQEQITSQATMIQQNSQEIILRALQETVDREFGDMEERVNTLETHLIISANDVRITGSDPTSYTYIKDNEYGIVVDGQTQFTQTQYGTETHAINIDGWITEVVNSGNTYIIHKKGS